MAVLKIVALLLVADVVLCQHGHGHNGGGTPDSGEVDTAISDLGVHYNDKLCLEILLVDCTKHVTQGDEQICGSDGKTYANHCLFTHALCEFLHSDVTLQVASHGACPVAGTTAAVAAGTSAIMAVTTMGASGMTNPPATVMASTVMPSTMAPAVSTTMATTPDPVAGIIQNVFCDNAASISCANGFQIICGSDGQLYPNQCELSKAKCKDPTLTIAETSTCATP